VLAADRPHHVTGARGRLLAVVIAVLVATGCRTDVLVRLDVDEDGSGTVSVGVGLDDEAAGRIPDLADQLRVDDLEQAGWTVAGPAEEDDGRTWVRASKPYASPEEASAVLSEVAGADGPFRAFTVARERSLARTELSVEGTVDLSGGLDAFSDPALAERLGGLPFGQELSDLLGDTAPGDAVKVTVAVGLPGDVQAGGATDQAPGVAVWDVPLGGRPVTVSATGSELRTATVAWLAVAALAALALVVVLAARVVAGARYRRY
jgi:hypothetical protein